MGMVTIFTVNAHIIGTEMRDAGTQNFANRGSNLRLFRSQKAHRSRTLAQHLAKQYQINVIANRDFLVLDVFHRTIS
ncbi:hypothetical protein [Chloroflexus sp.]|uniref:hypothetical protein n=1 Tax=Chloroflexus sp. TaxID=1904827 RepID=UPI002ADDE89C|nr:hypothetical protein [Chloroflexus sp.]